MLLGDGSRAAALPILQDLYKSHSKHPQVLELLSRCYRDLGDWDPLQELLPVLRKTGVLNEEQAQVLQEEIAVNKLRSATKSEHLQAAWKQLPRAVVQHATVVEAFAVVTTKLGQTDLAEPAIATSLKNAWSPSLILRYGDPASADRIKRIKQCEKWLQEYPADAGEGGARSIDDHRAGQDANSAHQVAGRGRSRPDGRDDHPCTGQGGG